MPNSALLKGDHIVILLLISLCSFSVSAKKIIQGITQDSENIVVAKGDIPTPEKFATNILN